MNTDTGPLEWNTPRASRREKFAHATVWALLALIATMVVVWGGR